MPAARFRSWGPGENYLDPEKYPLESLTPLPARRGSMLFLNYLTVHGSRPNTSRGPRRALFIQVRDPADRPTEKGPSVARAGNDAGGRASLAGC